MDESKYQRMLQLQKEIKELTRTPQLRAERVWRAKYQTELDKLELEYWQEQINQQDEE